MQIHVECTAGWLLPVDSLGETKSKRSRLGPGAKWTRALKWEALTGQPIDGKLSW